MDNQRLIPPDLPRPSLRQILLAAFYGAIGGGILGFFLWLITGDLQWFWAVPILAILGVFVRSERPNVLWSQSK